MPSGIHAIFFPVVYDRLTSIWDARWPFSADLVGVSFKGPTPENRYSLHHDFDVTLTIRCAIMHMGAG
jgi:hypothetical protein